MRKIFKYPLADAGIINMPAGFIVRHIGIQCTASHQLGQPMAWIEVDDQLPTHEWQVVRVDTGAPIPPPEQFPTYLGTTLVSGGVLVWHYYVVKRA